MFVMCASIPDYFFAFISFFLEFNYIFIQRFKTSVGLEFLNCRATSSPDPPPHGAFPPCTDIRTLPPFPYLKGVSELKQAVSDITP